MRGSSTGVTSVTTNHRFSTNLRLFTKRCNFVPFFSQKVPFDMVGNYLRNENEKFLFFLNDIKKTCVARGSFRSLGGEGTYSN